MTGQTQNVNSTITCDEVEEWSAGSQPLLLTERSQICIGLSAGPVPHSSHSYRCPAEPGVRPNGKHNKALQVLSFLSCHLRVYTFSQPLGKKKKISRSSHLYPFLLWRCINNFPPKEYISLFVLFCAVWIMKSQEVLICDSLLKNWPQSDGKQSIAWLEEDLDGWALNAGSLCTCTKESQAEIFTLSLCPGRMRRVTSSSWTTWLSRGAGVASASS